MFELAKKACGVGGPPTRSGVNTQRNFVFIALNYTQRYSEAIQFHLMIETYLKPLNTSYFFAACTRCIPQTLA